MCLKRNSFSAIFIKNLRKVFQLNGLANMIFLSTAFLFTKIIGAAEYGSVSVVNNMVLFLMIPCNMGATQVLYRRLALPNSTEDDNDVRLISSAFYYNLALSGIFSACYALLFYLSGNISGLDPALWGSAILVAVTINFYSLSEAFLRGKQLFGKIGQWQLMNALCFAFFCVFFLFVMRIRVFWTYFAAFILARTLFIVLSLRFNRPSWKHVSPFIIKDISRYGKSIMGNLFLGNLILAADVLLLNYFYSDADVGIYAAYKGGGILLFSVLFYEIFAVVFLPAIAPLSVQEVLKKLIQWSPIFLAGYSLFSGLAISVYVYLLRGDYVFRVQYVLLMALFSGIYALYQLTNHVINNGGELFAGISFRVTAVLTLPSFLFLSIMIQRFSLPGAFIGMSIVHGVLLVGITYQAFKQSLPKERANVLPERESTVL